ncbi:MAG TPA: TonB-dependent receptor, partial [Sphingomicrobium sp.]
SVVNPEQYRGTIIDLIAKDTAETSARFGSGYGVEVTGLDRPVQWKRTGLTEVQLFLPSATTVRPRN